MKRERDSKTGGILKELVCVCVCGKQVKTIPKFCAKMVPLFRNEMLLLLVDRLSHTYTHTHSIDVATHGLS